jgi:hypothetical protein
MAYSDFTLDSACRAFSLTLNDQVDLFLTVVPVRVSEVLRAILDENYPLATSIHTEKARSEFLVAPVLVEVRKLMKHRISLFSGTDFNVDPAQGLNGVCDFLLSASPVQLMVRAPVLAVVEAKNDNIKGGLGQCIAAMVAARLFNEREREGPSTIHGVVTTGSLWTFLKLEDATVFIDSHEHTLEPIGKLLAILLHCVGGDPAEAGAAA